MTAQKPGDDFVTNILVSELRSFTDSLESVGKSLNARLEVHAFTIRRLRLAVIVESIAILLLSVAVLLKK